MHESNCRRNETSRSEHILDSLEEHNKPTKSRGDFQRHFYIPPLQHHATSTTIAGLKQYTTKGFSHEGRTEKSCKSVNRTTLTPTEMETVKFRSNKPFQACRSTPAPSCARSYCGKRNTPLVTVRLPCNRRSLSRCTTRSKGILQHISLDIDKDGTHGPGNFSSQGKRTSARRASSIKRRPPRDGIVRSL